MLNRKISEANRRRVMNLGRRRGDINSNLEPHNGNYTKNQPQHRISVVAFRNK